MKRIFSLLATAVLMVGCVSNAVDEFRGDNSNTNTEKANDFNFSTVNDVILNVDYSASNPNGAVFFSVYSENPMKDDVLDESIKPIYSNYTDAKGRFNKKITLPSYAGELFIYSGNFFVTNDVISAEVKDSKAVAVAESAPAAARARRASETNGIQTNSLETFYQLSNLVNWRTGEKLDQQIYKEWHTPLGTWDKENGRPSYLMTEDDPAYSRLAFTDEEMKGIYQSITGAVTRKQTCPKVYRESADLKLTENSEVAVMLIGSNTCWNNTLGYYYYMEGEEPQSREDLNVIMLFPNTQDGHSEFIKKSGNSQYYGNIALDRGESVKLMYYPYIANDDYSGATSVFPAGMRIGFLLKSNGWGMQLPQGDKVFYNGYRGALKNSNIARQYNCWSASTDGMSYCEYDAEQHNADDKCLSKPNPTGKSRTAKFAFENEDGKQCAIVSFEDAANDEDYGDVILAMKPVGVFESLPTVEPRVTTTQGVYAYEDLWPNKGDYDLNDAVVDFKENRELSVVEYGGEYKITKQVFSLTTYQNYVQNKSGLAATLETKKQPSRIVMKKIAPNGSEPEEVTYTVDGKEYLFTDNITKELHSTYILELIYENGISEGDVAKIKPFIWRVHSEGKRWEVHIPMEAPTAKMETSYFGTEDDASDPSKKLYYVRKGDYPFSFFLSAVDINVFKNTILLRENESRSIDVFFPEFLGWSQSAGTKNKEWYKHPVK